MRYLFFLLVAFIMLSNCGISYQYTQIPSSYEAPRKVIPVYIDKTFGEADKLSISDAISQWNHVLNGSIQLAIVNTTFDMEPHIIAEAYQNGGYLFLKVNSNTSSFIPDVKPGDTLAWVDAVGIGHKLYVVRNRISGDEMFKEIVLHEIGHLLGAEHLQENSLMLDKYDHKYYRCIDDKTMKAVARYQFIYPSTMNYCIYN